MICYGLIPLMLIITVCKNPLYAQHADGKCDKPGEIICGYPAELPEFPGGEDSLFKFIAENIIYPEAARKDRIEGSVIVSFTVSKTGEINDVLIVKGIGGGCDGEVIRVINMMPRWKPGTEYGKPVKVMYRLPVQFTLKK